MVTPEDVQGIHDSLQNDVWQFSADSSGFFWIRIASNGEVVGTSHRAFVSKEDCENNARMVGYENQFIKPSAVEWQLYTDTKAQHRWRLLDAKGVVVNRSHDGYTSKDARDKNAIRHGYHLPLSEHLVADHNCVFACTPTVLPVPFWLRLLLVVGIIAVFAFVLASYLQLNIVDSTKNSDEIVINEAQCIAKLEDEGVLQGHKNLQGQPDTDLQIESFISQQELTKMLMVATDNTIFACAPTSSEPAGENWAWPYINCAHAKGWQLYRDIAADYTVLATKSDLLLTLLDAYELTAAEADERRLFKSLGDFDPAALITRADVALSLCTARAIVGR